MDSNRPLVSIVIPVYNREKFVKTAIEASINQTYKNIEIIVGDNCSTDNTWEVIQNYVSQDNRIIAFQNSSNLGPVLNWKACLEHAHGEYVKILWSDDWMSEGFIEHAVSLMDKHTAFVMSYVQVIKDNEVIYAYEVKKQSIKCDEYLKYALRLKKHTSFPVSPGCALFRLYDLKEALILDVPNDNNLKSRNNGAGNDLLLYLITASKYNYVRIIPAFENFFRAHSGSITISSDLEIYYEWSKVHFVEKYMPSAKTHYKYKYWRLFKIKKKEKFAELYKRSQDWKQADIQFCVKKILYRVSYEIKVMFKSLLKR